MSMYSDERGEPKLFPIVRDFCLVLMTVIVLAMWGCPKYNVYSQEMHGHAEFARAESNRKIAVLEAQAKLDSSKLAAQADIERAKGQQQANAIIAGGLGGPEGYLRFLWIEALQHSKDSQIIYVPTEAGLPILEAGKRR